MNYRREVSFTIDNHTETSSKSIIWLTPTSLLNVKNNPYGLIKKKFDYELKGTTEYLKHQKDAKKLVFL